MAYSLRLPVALDAAARTRADYLGISLNSLLCVALDAYLRAPGDAAPPVEIAPASVPTKPATDPPGGLTKQQRQEFTRQQRLARKLGR